MVRLAKSARDWSDDEDEDEFPDVFSTTPKRERSEQVATAVQPEVNEIPKLEKLAKPVAAVRRRKLGPVSDNLLLRAWTPESAEDEKSRCREKETSELRRTRVELRARRAKQSITIPRSPEDNEEEYISAQEEATVEDTSLFDATFHSCASRSSESNESEYEEEEDDDRDYDDDDNDDGDKLHCGKEGERAMVLQIPSCGFDCEFRQVSQQADLEDLVANLSSDDALELPPETTVSSSTQREATLPSSSTKSHPGLVSPKKLPRIPTTPHRPSTDMFWSQEFVDDWNDKHSPRKQLFPDTIEAKKKGRVKESPQKTAQKSSEAKAVSQRGQKKAFEKIKHEMAESFLSELDTVITGGKLAGLTAATGGIQLVWSNKLKTTAGRAHWKCEAIRTGGSDGTTKSMHRAWIELSDKVVDNEHRLLNTLAHEFCHAATYMISGVTKNPHGPEFQAWGDKCSRAFSDRGISVTTKHSYEIDFKYVWECVECTYEYKRHSKSINPARHRCGKCKSELKQIKPVPRKTKEGDGPQKVTEYQAFMKEQMRLIRTENPKTPQKDVIKIVASRWAALRSKSSTPVPEESVEEVTKSVGELDVGGKRYEYVDLVG
ncbi:Acidic repeat-containing protein [Madurella mycetomatis]|uniref:Acidic repeat-containing protein n=1 Tax=Madurella mycetomatis TaxID=100816 RepID=A0A175WF49_9PEZI|nr:Acidic repeat-containing protein [Madurella mycetomatis]